MRVQRALPPADVERSVTVGSLELLDLRTWPERALFGSPPHARHVSLLVHLVRPAGPGYVYLCTHAVRTKWTLRRGAIEVEGGFRRWRTDGVRFEGGLLTRPDLQH